MVGEAPVRSAQRTARPGHVGSHVLLSVRSRSLALSARSRAQVNTIASVVRSSACGLTSQEEAMTGSVAGDPAGQVTTTRSAR